MSKNMVVRDIKTVGYVLRRTNYGESDRILNLITPQGKISAIARAARKEKSKLAGGIEMFTRSEFNIHMGRGELGIVTSAKMQKFHGGIIKDLARMELAAKILKKISLAAESSNTEEYFGLTDQSFSALGVGENAELVEAWFLVNLKRVMGEEINLHRDKDGQKLIADQNYAWDNFEKAFVATDKGEYGANEIKFLRLMASSELAVIQRVKNSAETLGAVLRLAREVI